MGLAGDAQGNVRVEIERYEASVEGVDMNTDLISVGFAYRF
jgi:hypothetical protein